MDRAGAAVGGVAADVGAGQTELIAQRVDQQQPRLDVELVLVAVHLETDTDGSIHASPPLSRAPPSRDDDDTPRGLAGVRCTRRRPEIGSANFSPATPGEKIVEIVDYHRANRELQDRYDTRRLADRINERLVDDEIDDEDKEFIESCDMLFIATADAEGRPNCSYKGGDPGFVRGARRAHDRVPVLRRQRHVPDVRERARQPECRAVVHLVRAPAAAATERRRVVARGAPAAGGVSRGAVRRRGQGPRGVPQLPALHPSLRAGRALEVRAQVRVRDTRPGLEAA